MNTLTETRTLTHTLTHTLTITLTLTLTYLLRCTPRDTILVYSSCSLHKLNHSSYSIFDVLVVGVGMFIPISYKDLPYPAKNLASSIKNIEYVIIIPFFTLYPRCTRLALDIS